MNPHYSDLVFSYWMKTLFSMVSSGTVMRAFLVRHSGPTFEVFLPAAKPTGLGET